MKISFLTSIFLFISCCAFAQKDIEKVLKQELWTNTTPEFKVAAVPEKYKNESAVILAYATDYTLTEEKGFTQKLSIHFRIKLLDKAAVSDYSELSFDKKNINANVFGKAHTYSIVGAKIVKPSGKENELDLSKGVKTDAGSSWDQKIAIPDLEIGDILDYFIAVKEISINYPFFNQSELLESKYPVVKRTIRYMMPNRFVLRSKVFNGAPDFKKTIAGKVSTYILSDEMRDKAPDLLWSYDHRSSPEIRYELLGPFGSDKTTETYANELLDSYVYQSDGADIGFIEDYFKVNFKKETDQRKIVYELYYLLRNPIYRKGYFGSDQSKPLELGSVPNLYFFLMTKCLKRYKIPHEIMVVPGRHFGPFESLTNLGSCDVIIKVNTSPAIYIPSLDPLSIPNETNYLFEEMTGVTKKVFPKKPIEKIDYIPIKATESDKNTTVGSYKIKLNEDKSGLEVKREVLAKGFNKSGYQNLIITTYDYLKEYDQPKYQVHRSSLYKSLIENYNSEKKKVEQRLTQDYNERDERIKKTLEDEFEVTISNYKELKVKSIGMWDKSPDTQFSDEFSLESVNKVAGPNIIVPIGKIIGRQTEVKSEWRTRTRDVDMNYARSFTNIIEFTIPDGYKVEGYETLNRKVENATGGFKSTAVIDGHTLKVNVNKYYSKHHVTAADWPKMVDFMDASVSFTNSKILLKKK